MLRPMPSAGRALLAAFLISIASWGFAGLARAQIAADRDFGRFVEELWPEAKARGVSRATFDEAFRGVAPDPKIIALTKKQSEFVRPIWEYIRGAVSNERLER